MARVAAVLVLALGVMGCGKQRVCAPGARVACACPGGSQGVQVCAPAGERLGECQCAAMVALPPAAEKSAAKSAALAERVEQMIRINQQQAAAISSADCRVADKAARDFLKAHEVAIKDGLKTYEEVKKTGPLYQRAVFKPHLDSLRSTAAATRPLLKCPNGNMAQGAAEWFVELEKMATD